MVKLLFKIVYFFRKKGARLRYLYLIKEQEVLFPGKVVFSEKCYFDKFPKLYFDNSASSLHIGASVSTRGDIIFSFLENGYIYIGENSFLNNGCAIHCLEQVQIGKNCLLGENVKIYDHNHRYEEAVPVRNQGYTTGKIFIGDNCWIGSNAIVLKGVHIGENSVIGANCVVHKNVPANSVLLSNGVLKPLKY